MDVAIRKWEWLDGRVGCGHDGRRKQREGKPEAMGGQKNRLM